MEQNQDNCMIYKRNQINDIKVKVDCINTLSTKP